MIKLFEKHIYIVIASLLLLNGIMAAVFLHLTASRKTDVAENKQLMVKAPGEVTLEIFSPDVWVLPPGEAKEVVAQDRQVILPGSKIRTGKAGRAFLWYPNHTVTRLNYNTEIVLKEFKPEPQQVSVYIKSGEIFSRIAKLFGNESYNTQTDSTVASVRGTAYAHSAVPSSNHTVAVTSGLVAVTYGNVSNTEADNQKSVALPAYTRATVTSGKDVEAVVDRMSEKDLSNEWIRFNLEQDEILEEEYKDAFHAQHKDDATVLGSAISPTAEPTKATVNCEGPDGISFKSSAADCESLKAYYKTHPTSIPSPTTKIIAQAPTSTTAPTQSPTSEPTNAPTNEPTAQPTNVQPSAAPSSTPTPPSQAPVYIAHINRPTTSGGVGSVDEDAVKPYDMTVMIAIPAGSTVPSSMQVVSTTDNKTFNPTDFNSNTGGPFVTATFMVPKECDVYKVLMTVGGSTVELSTEDSCNQGT